MNKTTSKILILSLLVVLFLSACGSDKKESNDDKIKSKSTAKSNNSFSSASGSNRDLVAEKKFDKDLKNMKANASKACDEIKTSYNKFKNSGDNGDGFDEILSIKSQFTNLAGDGLFGEYGSADEVKSSNWPDYGKYRTFYNDSIQPYLDKMDSFYDSLNDVTEAAIYDEQSKEQLDQIHQTMKDFSDYMSTSEFGPCDL